jgi:chemotaxis protein methyltransferase CheR
MASLARARADRDRPAAAAFTAEPPVLSDRDLAKIMRLVYEESGITLHSGKRALVMARLQKLLRRGGFGSFKDYIRHLQNDKSGHELTAMLDAIATNHTAFFREPQHFTFLTQVVFPGLEAKSAVDPIRGWSAACSTGEEPYTIAMNAFEHFGPGAAGMIRLLASDLSTKALMRAASGLYRPDRVESLPRHLVLKYFEKQPPAQGGGLRVAEPLRRVVEFRHMNLLRDTPRGRPFDFIFCRNVLIYFDRVVQQRVLDLLEDRLAPGGYLFTSHSESLNGLRHGLKWMAPAVYRRAGS